MIKLYTRNRLLVILLVLFIFSLMLLNQLIALHARGEVASFLERVAATDNATNPPKAPSIAIDGKGDKNSAETLTALQQIAMGTSHHSHPTDQIDVVVRDGKRSLRLLLRRDSSNRQEYWVFCPDCRFAWSDIGRVTTDAFDRY